MWKNWDPCAVACGNLKWRSCCGKQYGGSLRKLNMELPFDPAIPLLGIYTKELKAGSQRDICAPMFIEALFTIAK